MSPLPTWSDQVLDLGRGRKMRGHDDDLAAEAHLLNNSSASVSTDMNKLNLETLIHMQITRCLDIYVITSKFY